MSGGKFIDYYALLGVPWDATEATIRKAYRTRARQLHPDKNRDDPDAATKFDAAKRARDVLMDATERAAFDGVLERQKLAEEREEREGASRKAMREDLREREAQAVAASAGRAMRAKAAEIELEEAKAGLRQFKLELARKRRGEFVTPTTGDRGAADVPTGAFEDDAAFASLPLAARERLVLARLDALASSSTRLYAALPPGFLESLPVACEGTR